jgi:hypothetical protein
MLKGKWHNAYSRGCFQESESSFQELIVPTVVCTCDLCLDHIRKRLGETTSQNIFNPGGSWLGGP